MTKKTKKTKKIKKIKKIKKLLVATLSLVAAGGVAYAICAHSALKEFREELMNDIENMKKE